MRSPTATKATRVVGIAAIVMTVAVLVLGGWVSPPAVQMGQLVRLIYVHPAMATYCYAGFGLCALGSIAYLWPRTRSRRWDQFAGASAEVGVVFCVGTLVTGSIWGRSTWGVWWTWDARLTLTALLLAVFLGYLALRRTGGDWAGRAKRCAVTALLCFIVVPIDHEATNWWSTLHQGDTLFGVGQSPRIHGWQLLTMLLSFVSFGLIFAWMVMHRYALEVLEDRFEDDAVVSALVERRAEGSPGRTSADGRGILGGDRLMSNPYVLGGYLAAVVILGVYVVHLLRRARVLSRALGERADLLARSAPSAPASPAPSPAQEPERP